MGDVEECRNEDNTCVVWVIKNFADYQKHYSIHIATTKILVKDSSDVWLIELWWKRGTNLYFKIKNIRCNYRNHENGEVRIVILNSDLCKAHEYSRKISLNYESEIDIKFTSLAPNNAILLYGKHLVLQGTLCFADSGSSGSCLEFGQLLVYQNLAKLLETGNYNDFRIKVNSNEFPCHKAILACRSTYFRDLFKENSQMSNLEVDDTEPKVFKKLLEYIYTDYVKVTEDVVLQLLDAASKFSLKGLKDICEKCLLSFFNLQNVFKLHEISCSHELDSVRERALCLIATFGNGLQMSFVNDEQHKSIRASEVDEDKAKVDEPGSTASDIVEAVNQSQDIVETAMTPFGKKPYLPAADEWYTVEYKTVFSYEWTFNIFAENEIRRQYFCDEESGCKFEINYQFELDKDGSKGACTNDFVLYLLFLYSIESSVTIKYSFYFLNEYLRPAKNIYDGSCTFSQYQTHTKKEVLRIDVDSIPLNRRKVSSLNCLILLENSFSHELKRSCLNESNLIRDISSLNADELFRDLVIRSSKGNEFSCHKAIVLNPCPFLEQKMSESVVVLEDIEPQTFRNFVSFLYGKTIMYGLSDKMAWDLVKFAHMFQMNDLLEMCADELITHLNIENALKAYDLSKTYSMAKLEEACFRFISKFFSKIFSKEQNRNHEFFKDPYSIRRVWKYCAN